MTNESLDPERRKALVARLKGLSRSHMEADFGSGVGGAARMTHIEVEATEVLKDAGFSTVMPLRSRLDIDEWARRLEAGEET